ncbi:unnamed protein product [Porites evermanni]|uniref:Uncharacterized protein n=1 Tax=Porites evermanni TaxID=104178 RepID=A0ABN8QTY3_9CNID|nr:unnamed protein product [Porites evermanni]
MPESTAILKKENQALKAEIDALSKTVNRLQAKVDQDASSGANASPTPNEGVKSLKFISDGFDYFNSFKKEAEMELKQFKSAQQTSSLCVSPSRALGADVPIRDIDSAHRVPMRQASGGPRPVICKFVRRLARDKVMARRREARNINPAIA